MADVKHLTIEEELQLYTGVVMNNWFALKVLVNNSNDAVDSINLKVKGLFNLLISGTHSIVDHNAHWADPTEAIEDYFDQHFNTYVEDDSCEEVLSDLVGYYHLLLDNKREVLGSKIAHFSDKKNIFTLEEYNPEKVVSVAVSVLSADRLPCCRVQEVPPESHKTHSNQQDTMMSESNMVTDSTNEPVHWETVQPRRNRKR